MQTRQSFQGWWDHFRQANGITMRIIAAMPPDAFDSHPIKNMRTPKELLAHMYGQFVRNVPVGIVHAEIKGFDEKSALATLKTKDDVIRFCRECWQAGDAAAKTITDAQLQAVVKTPWDMSMPGWVCAGVICDEYFHHRGQVYAFARALGLEPPMMWDFEHNEAAFRPKETARA